MHEIRNAALTAKRNASSAYATSWHAHDCGMLLIPLAGRLRVSDEVREGFPVTPGLFVWTPQSLGHQTVAQSLKQSHVALYLDSGFFAAALKAQGLSAREVAPGVRHVSKVLTYYASTINDLLEKSAGAQPAHDLREVVTACGGALMQEAVRLISTQQVIVSNLHLGRASAVLEACEILQSSLIQPPQLPSLADRLNMSARQLQRLFKAETGLTIEQYVCEQRIEKAKDLLKRTRLPVADIACAVGWESSSYLALKFRESVGLSPTAYRAQLVPSLA